MSRGALGARSRSGRLAGLGLLLALGLGLHAAGFAQDEETAARSTRPRSATRSSQQGGGADAKLDAKLDEILANQQRILARLDEVMEELKIIKIRATLK